MKTVVAAVAMAGCAAASVAFADQALEEAGQQARQMPGNAARSATLFFDPVNMPFSLPGNNITSYSVPLGIGSAVFANVGTPDSYMRLPLGINASDISIATHWLEQGGTPRMFTVGYAWRMLTLEGTAISGAAQDEHRPLAPPDTLKLESASTRLSYSPSPNWSLQFSRGTLSGLDQLAADEEVRRVAISATYKRALTDGDWQSTLAWGRSARKSREPTMGYLLESTLRFSGVHTLFGRLEQVGSSELTPEGGAAQSQAFKLNRLTVGYFHEVGKHGPVRLDAGAFVSRYAVPSSASAIYGDVPNSFVLFVRLNLR